MRPGHRGVHGRGHAAQVLAPQRHQGRRLQVPQGTRRRLWRRRCWVPAAEERGGAELFWVVVVVFCGVRRGAAARGPGAGPQPGAAAGSRDGHVIVIAVVQETNRLLN